MDSNLEAQNKNIDWNRNKRLNTNYIIRRLNNWNSIGIEKKQKKNETRNMIGIGYIGKRIEKKKKNRRTILASKN